MRFSNCEACQFCELDRFFSVALHHKSEPLVEVQQVIPKNLPSHFQYTVRAAGFYISPAFHISAMNIQKSMGKKNHLQSFHLVNST